MSDDITKLSAVEMAAAMSAGDVSSRELTEAHLARISQVDDEVHARVALTAPGVTILEPL